MGWFLFLLLCAVIGVVVIYRRKKNELLAGIPPKRKTVAEELAAVDAMTGEQFERYCIWVLRGSGLFEGFTFSLTPPTGDFGVDIVAQHSGDGSKFVIQCKRYNKNLGVKPVQEVAAGRDYYGASGAAVITNSAFTKNAVELAESTNVNLYDRNTLAGLIKLTIEREEQAEAEKRREEQKKSAGTRYCTCENPAAKYLDDEKMGWKKVCQTCGREIRED